RLPDTLNSRNNAECKVMIVNEDITYSMYELREKYLKWKPKVFKEIKIKENKKEFKVLQFFTSYTLHMARMQDLETLCKIRKYRVTGYRNIILHCYAYWIGVTTRDSDNLKEAVNELNNKFTQPMKQTEVDAILRCVPKAIDKFLAYEQGLRSGEVKRVSKGMRDKGGYWYKNETLIERLDITIAEQKQLKTIIGREVKYDRRRAKDNESKRAKRRNEDGLTKKQLEMRELKVKVLELKEQGMSLRKIAKEVGKAKGTIENILKK
ncbi:MAG: helix-turn-helix domain-containing protein, partial [Sarcina sp.]